MAKTELCNRQTNGYCDGCNVPSILVRKVEYKDEVDKEAERISLIYCPENSGGIDYPTRGTIYNYRPERKTKSRKIRVW